jgi:hypothetical protein
MIRESASSFQTRNEKGKRLQLSGRTALQPEDGLVLLTRLSRLC